MSYGMNNPPAFPATADLGDRVRVYKGMTLRDYFAAKAMQAYLGKIELNIHIDKEGLSQESFAMADAMLKARKQ